jgi:hypothetical protein
MTGARKLGVGAEMAELEADCLAVRDSGPSEKRTLAKPNTLVTTPIASIDAVLETDRSVHAKQSHTAQRLFDRLRAGEGYTGG